MNDFLTLLPQSINKDETVRRLASVLNSEIDAIDETIKKNLIYSELENHDEAIIDELAWSLHMTAAEGYRFADTLEKKRELVKSALILHRHKGTLYAVKEVLNILGIKGKVLEWFQYGGRQYYFKIDAQLGEGIGENDIAILEALLNEFKNVRSHLEGITFRLIAEGSFNYCLAGLSGEFMTVWPYVPHEIIVRDSAFCGGATAIDEQIEIMPGGK